MSESPYTQRLKARVAVTAARVAEHVTRQAINPADLASVRLPWFAVHRSADESPQEPTGDRGRPDEATATVFIFDEIGGSLGIDATELVREIEGIEASVIRVRVNSPGGNLFDALGIMNALRHHPARVVVYVDSLAASAASVVAMAGDEIVMMPGAQMMIHDASSVMDGDAAGMAKMSTFLDRQSQNVAELYAARAGGEPAHWRELMLAETWMFAREAVRLRLADRVVEARPPDAGPELERRMARSHDLRAYRYAGRELAPSPVGAPTGPMLTRSREAVTALEGEPGTSMATAALARARHYASRGVLPMQMVRDAAGLPMLSAREQPSEQRREPTFPTRYVRAALVRWHGHDRHHVSGYATAYGQPYEMWDEFGPYEEEVEAGALDQSLAAGPDVAFLVNHRGLTMARTVSSSPGVPPSLRLSSDERGLAVESWLNPKRADVQDLVAAIEDGQISEMSFGVLLKQGRWNRDFTRFTLTELDIHRGDVSAVNYGANPQTSIGMRSAELMRELGMVPVGAAREALSRLQARLGGQALAIVDEPVGHADGASAPGGRSIVHIEALLAE